MPREPPNLPSKPPSPPPPNPPQVREVAEEAIARARRGDGPTLIEAETYRFRGHSLADPDELRSKEEKAKYAVRESPRGRGAPRPSRRRIAPEPRPSRA